MKVAIVNETSAADKNEAILAALDNRGLEVINAGMTKNGVQPELSYIQTGLITAILLNLKKADLVVGGCGTGQGYLLSAMQYPGVLCGHVVTALDAWLFSQINGGNCISLALNQGYGWAGEVNIKFIFDRFFEVENGCGYPEHRKEPQKAYRKVLDNVSEYTHTSFADTIKNIPDNIILPALEYPGIWELIDVDTIEDEALKQAFKFRMSR